MISVELSADVVVAWLPTVTSVPFVGIEVELEAGPGFVTEVPPQPNNAALAPKASAHFDTIRAVRCINSDYLYF